MHYTLLCDYVACRTVSWNSKIEYIKSVYYWEFSSASRFRFIAEISEVFNFYIDGYVNSSTFHCLFYVIHF